MSANVEHMAYRFANRSDTPWHGVGTPIARNEELSTEEFQKRAGAEWLALKRKLYFRSKPALLVPDIEVPKAFALARNDNQFVLNIVSEQYKIVQNKEVFNFFQEFCNAGDMDMETGGVLDYGRTVWGLANIREGFTLSGGDHVQGFLLFSNSHGGSAGRIKFTPVRVVCANTLALALGGSGTDFRIHHKATFDPEIAKTALGLGHKQLSEFKEQAEFLTTRRMSSVAFTEFLEKLFPPRDVVDEKGRSIDTVTFPRMYHKSLAALSTQKGAHMSEGTWWQGYNAITYAIDHDITRSDRAALFNSNMFGNGFKVKQQALQTALEFAR